MAVFRLTSDNEFVVAAPDGSADVLVLEYTDDPTSFSITRPAPISGALVDGLRIITSPKAEYKALNVMGVVIKGRRLRELANDLVLQTLDGGVLPLVVNRRGLCLATNIDHPSIWRLRINDYFGWSKYGVRPPKSGDVTNGACVWNKCDMYSGAKVVDVEGAVEEARWLRERLEEERKEVEDGRSKLAVCEKEVECLKEAAEMRKREVEVVNGQLFMKTDEQSDLGLCDHSVCYKEW